MPHLQLRAGASNKQWSAHRAGRTIVTKWGTAGAAPASKTEAHPDLATARAAINRLIAQRTGQGFVRPADRPSTAPAKETLPVFPDDHYGDVDPFAVLADWLIERGNGWGELIAAQLADTRAGVDSSEASREALIACEDALLGPAARCSGTALHLEWKRGFVEEVVWIPDVIETWASPNELLVSLLSLSPLRLASILEIHGAARATGDALSGLARAANPPPFKTLRIRGPYAGDIFAFAETPLFRALDVLDLSGNELSDDDFEPWLRDPSPIAHLFRLYLNDNELSDEVKAALAGKLAR